MISVIIPTLNDERRLVPTLAALVAGAADGLVVEAIVADGGSTDDTAAVADMAGCRMIEGPADTGPRLARAAAMARAPWLMFVEPGTVLDEGWTRDVRAFLEQVARRGEIDRRAAVFAPGTDDFGMRGVMHRLTLWAWLTLGRGPDPSLGLLVSARHYRGLGGHPDGRMAQRRLGRRIGRRRISVLRSRATALGQ
ncbi:glycosyltransferase [Phreatobacter sp.]|uniref:glycosyltransferase n=1 Tax=Phreatobacter sp. TaxID=1966341 RepID=UPI003F7177D5